MRKKTENTSRFMKTDVKLTSMVKTSGCAAKLPPEKLHRVIDNLP